jgi:hypothetical protein
MNTYRVKVAGTHFNGRPAELRFASVAPDGQTAIKRVREDFDFSALRNVTFVADPMFDERETTCWQVGGDFLAVHKR